MDQMMMILAQVEELREDETVPRNIKGLLERVSSELQSEEEMTVRVNNALHMLDEISEDSNVKPYTRSQLLHIVSALEAMPK